jgi:equilibrative nucleoside transporter 1/2/3
MYSSIDKQYLCYLLLGVGTLAPWNAFITAADYYALRYPVSLPIFQKQFHPGPLTVYGFFVQGYHVDRLLTICYLPVNFLVLLAFIYAHDRVQQKLRIVAGFVSFTVAVLLTPVMDLFPAGKGSLAFMLFLIAVCGAADGACQGALFGEAAVLDGRYTQALIAGTAISGVSISFLRIITKALLPATPAGLRASADLYFILAAGTCGCCVVIHSIVLPSLRGEGNTTTSSSSTNPRLNIIYSDDPSVDNNGDSSITAIEASEEQPSGRNVDRRRDHEDSNAASEDFLLSSIPLPQRNHKYHSPTYLEVAYEVRIVAIALVFIYLITLAIFPGVLAEDVSSVSLKTWYPVILMFIFNLFDCAGKWLPILPKLQLNNASAIATLAACRVIFIPAFHVAAIKGVGGVITGFLAASLGLSNGYLTASAMILGPKIVESRAAALCGNIMVLSLIAGLCIGAACGFLWLLV